VGSFSIFARNDLSLKIRHIKRLNKIKLSRRHQSNMKITHEKYSNFSIIIMLDTVTIEAMVTVLKIWEMFSREAKHHRLQYRDEKKNTTTLLAITISRVCCSNFISGMTSKSNFHAKARIYETTINSMSNTRT
jgi:hypothetical protein